MRYRGPRTSLYIRINHEFSMMPNVCLFFSRVHLLIRLSSLPPPPPPTISLYIFFYLFKAEIYGLYQAWKGKQMLQLTEITGFYFTAVYLFILGICFLSFFLLFFFEQIKSFSIPKRLSVVVFLFSFRLHFKLKPNS